MIHVIAQAAARMEAPDSRSLKAYRVMVNSLTASSGSRVVEATAALQGLNGLDDF